MLHGGASVIVLARNGLRGMTGDSVDGGLNYAFAVAHCISQVRFEGVSKRVNAFAVVWLVNPDFPEIAFGAVVKELAGILGPAFFAVINSFVARFQVGKSVSK